jgi:hypothetical protein
MKLIASSSALFSEDEELHTSSFFISFIIQLSSKSFF